MKQAVAYLLLVIKGAIYGVTNILPGIGGGLILIILGIYQRFVDSIGNFFLDLKSWRKHLAFIIPFMIGAALGMVLFAKAVTIIMERQPVASMFLFMGLVVGTIPSVFKQAADMRLTFGRAAAALAGVLVVVLFQYAENHSFSTGWTASANTVGGFAYYTVSSFVAGGGSVTPGLDGSYIWMLTGVYEAVMAAISSVSNVLDVFKSSSGGLLEVLGTLHWAVLFATGIGAVLGIIVFSKLVDMAVKKIPSITFYVVLGLLGASVYGLWPLIQDNAGDGVTYWPVGAGVTWAEVLLVVAAFVVGLAVTLFAGSRPESSQAE